MAVVTICSDFGGAKETVSKVKRQPSEWEKIMAYEITLTKS